jgi:hypothetical protein
MAPKPKGWKDNPLGEIQKLYNAWQPNYTDPQSLAQFKETSKQVGSMGLQAADLYTTGGLGLSFAQNVIQPAATIASKETRTAAASKGMTQFAKDAAVTAASAGAAVVAGKVVSKGAAKVVESGIPARLSNMVKGETVVVHGTGRPIVGNTINPKAGSAYSPNKPAAFAWNTQYGSGKTDGQNWMHQALQEYSNRPYINAKGISTPGEGNIVIGKTKIKDAIPELSSQSVIASNKPIKITKVIKEEPIGAKVYEQRENFIRELKIAGVKTKSGPVRNMLDKAEAAKIAKRQRIANKNSPV